MMRVVGWRVRVGRGVADCLGLVEDCVARWRWMNGRWSGRLDMKKLYVGDAFMFIMLNPMHNYLLEDAKWWPQNGPPCMGYSRGKKRPHS